MSSNCPPQLHLELPANTTSFKRSFDQFGFDLESPLGGSEGAGAGGSDGNDRNKRARSASSFSDDADSVGSSQSSTIASGSSSMSVSGNELDAQTQSALSATRPEAALNTPQFSPSLARTSLEPPRLPTPELQDIDMADYPLVGDQLEEASSLSPTRATSILATTNTDENYRLSLERFNAFDSQISALRRSRSPTLVRSPTPPPVLPPLALLDDQTQLSTNTIPFLQPPAQPSPPLPEALYSFGLSRSQRPVSRAASRAEGRQDGLGQSNHELYTHTEGSTSPREYTPTPLLHVAGIEALSSDIPSLPPSWSYWQPEEIDGDEDDDDDDDDNEEVEEEGNTFTSFRRMSPIPAIRSPSPLFEDLNELRSSSSSSTRRALVPATPPTLPPIHNDNDTWDDPLEGLRIYSSSLSRTESSDPSGRATQPPPLHRISIPRDRPPAQDRDREESQTTSTTSSSDDHIASHVLPSPFLRELGGWMDTDPTVFGLSSDWSLRPTSSSPREDNVASGNFNPYSLSNMGPTSNRSGTGNSTNNSSNRINPRVARIEALHGIGEALQGLGRALQESEITLRPLRFMGSPGNNESPSNPFQRDHPSSSSSEDSRALAMWRSNYESDTNDITGVDIANGNGNESDSGEPAIPRRLRLNAPSGSPLEVQLRPWLADRPNRDTTSSNTSNFDRSSERHQVMDNREVDGMSVASWFDDEALRQNRLESEESVSSGRGDTQHNGQSPPQVSSTSGRPRWPWAGGDAIQPSPPEFVARPASPSPFGSEPDFIPFPPVLRSRQHTHSYLNSTVGVRASPNTTSPAPSSPNHTSPEFLQALQRLRNRPHMHAQSVDAGLFGVRRSSDTTNTAASSSSTSASPFATSPSLRLRSRPYISHSHSHTHTHSHSISHTRLGAPPASVQTESPAEARRRNARLELIEMHRPDRTRVPETQRQAIRPWETVNPSSLTGHEPSLQSAGQPPPVRMPLHQLMAARQARETRRRPRSPTHTEHMFDGLGPFHDEDDYDYATGSPSNLVDVAIDLDRNIGRSDDMSPHESILEHSNRDTPIGRPPRRTPRGIPRIPTPPPHSVPRHWRSTADQMFGDMDDEIERLNRRANMRARNIYGVTRLHRQDSALDDYLVAPSLPTPGLGALFDFIDHSNGSEQPPRSDETRPSSPPRPSFRRYPPSSRYRSPSPVRDDPSRRAIPPQRRNSPSRGPSGMAGSAMNPNSYAPGPFRNTVQRIFEANQARENRVAAAQSQSLYNPPSIPPLPFESDFQSSLYDSAPRDNGATHTSRPSRQEPPPVDDSGPMYGEWFNPDEQDRPRRPIQHSYYGSWSSQPSSRPQNEDSSSSQTSRRPSDLHSVLTRHARIEASRVENPDLPDMSDGEGFNNPQRFSQAIQLLRHDTVGIPRSQDIINRFRRDRERNALESRNTSTSSTSSSSPWGIVEGNTSTQGRQEPPPEEVHLARRHGHQLSSDLSRYAAASAGHERTATNTSSREADRARLAASRARRLRRPHEALFLSNPPLQDYLRLGLGRRGARAFGDYMRDEDFDESYESLLSLAASLGDAKPRATPDSVISTLETGLYKDWKTPDSDHRCPICLDDYEPDDPLLKLADCSHWLHRECLQQWLKGASTCPVCRKTVGGSRRHHHHHHHGLNEPGPSRRRSDPGNGPGGGSSSSGPPGGSGVLGEWPPWRYGQGA